MTTEADFLPLPSPALNLQDDECTAGLFSATQMRQYVLADREARDAPRAFNLEAAQRGDPIVTRGGASVRFLAYVPEAEYGCRVVVYIEGSGAASSYRDDGKWVHSNGQGNPHSSDLLMAAKGNDQ